MILFLRKVGERVKAAKGKTQVTLTLPVEMRDRLLDLANEADRTLAGYIRWMLNESLKKMDKENR